MDHPRVPRVRQPKESEERAEEVFALRRVSSEPESNGRGQTPMEQSQTEENTRQTEQEISAEQNDSQTLKIDPSLLPRPKRVRGELYNFKGFMFFCFGVPGVAPNWCSCLLYFYHVILFAVGIGTVILGGISLALREEMSHTKQFIFADILSILAGVLYLVAAFFGGCIWTWRTSFLPACCTRSFLPLAIVAWLLSLTHAALVAAFVAVMINYGNDIIHHDLKFKLNLLSLWTLGGLVVWAVVLLVGLFPTVVLFRRRYRPQTHN